MPLAPMVARGKYRRHGQRRTLLHRTDDGYGLAVGTS